MAKQRKRHRLVDAYAFPGFRPRAFVQGMFGDAWARIVTLDRRGKKRSVGRAGQCTGASTTGCADECGICSAVSIGSGWIWKSAESIAVRAMR